MKRWIIAAFAALSFGLVTVPVLAADSPSPFSGWRVNIEGVGGSLKHENTPVYPGANNVTMPGAMGGLGSTYTFDFGPAVIGPNIHVLFGSNSGKEHFDWGSGQTSTNTFKENGFVAIGLTVGVPFKIDDFNVMPFVEVDACAGLYEFRNVYNDAPNNYHYDSTNTSVNAGLCNTAGIEVKVTPQFSIAATYTDMKLVNTSYHDNNGNKGGDDVTGGIFGLRFNLYLGGSGDTSQQHAGRHGNTSETY